MSEEKLQNPAEEEPLPETERKPNQSEEDALPPPPPPDYLGMTLSSGVAPLEMRFSQINSCQRKLPMAYRTHTYINSITVGVIPPEKYAFAADSTDRGLRLAKWNLEEAITAVRKLENTGRKISFVTARCPARLAFDADVYEWAKQILEETDFHSPEKLCIEFPQSLLFEDIEKARLAVLNLKLLKIKTLLSGCGASDCPVTNLINVPVDYVLLDPAVTTLVDSRDKQTAVSSLIAFLRSMQIDVIGDGVYNDGQITALNRADCVGYIPSSGFHGTVRHGSLRMTIEDAVAQSDEEAY